MGEKHLIKILTLLWRVSTTAVWTTSFEKNPDYSVPERATFFRFTTQNWHWFTCTRGTSLCVPATPSVQIQIGCHVRVCSFGRIRIRFSDPSRSFERIYFQIVIHRFHSGQGFIGLLIWAIRKRIIGFLIQRVSLGKVSEIYHGAHRFSLWMVHFPLGDIRHSW